MDFIINIVTFCAILGAVSSHPQCLDFRPPFEPTDPPQFCTEYSDITCCSAAKDNQIRGEYDQVLERAKARGIYGCDDYVKTLLCQKCSPYAAHLFNGEAGVAREMPGLGTQYCGRLYTYCRDVLRFMYNSNSYLTGTTLGRAMRRRKWSFCRVASLGAGSEDYNYPDLLTNPVLNGDLTRDRRTEDGCLCLEPFADNIANPLALRSPPDGTARKFVLQQNGTITIFHQDKTKPIDRFLDFNAFITIAINEVYPDERGLLNLAFHPDFRNNRKFYLFYVDTIGTDQHMIRVSEYRAQSNNPNKADLNSGRLIISIPKKKTNHNGGEMFFGTDGYLYLFVGDGGGAGDPDGNAQNLHALLGKVLRIDVDETRRSTNYGIPKDNPFKAPFKEEIFAYGLRNPWRCDVDEGNPDTGYGRGRIICGDVGQEKREEIDMIKVGGNYGWNRKEGDVCYPESSDCSNIGENVLPVFAYDHAEGKSVIGGSIYRGCMSPDLQGLYFMADYMSGKLWSLREQANGSWEPQERVMCGIDVCIPGERGLTNTYPSRILSFGEDADGEVYILATEATGTFSSNVGKILKIVEPTRRGDPTNCRSFTDSDRAPAPSSTTTPPSSTTSPPITTRSTTTTVKTTTSPPTTTRSTTTTVKTTTTSRTTRATTTTSRRGGWWRRRPG